MTCTYLDLAHGRTTADTWAGAGTTTAREAREDGRHEEGCETEPQEGGRGLSLAAALGRALADVVVAQVVL